MDLNAFGKEFYLEANSAWIKPNETEKALSQIKLNITEMNLAGSIALEKMNKLQEPTQWKAQVKPIHMMQVPKDNIGKVNLVQGGQSTEEIWNVSLEPQRLRVFSIRFDKVQGGTAAVASTSTAKATEETKKADEPEGEGDKKEEGAEGESSGEQSTVQKRSIKRTG